MVGGRCFGILCVIQLSIALSIQVGGLVPGWNLVLVYWECETVSCHVDNHLVAVWAHSLGALVTASVAAVATATTTIAAATTATTAAATTAISFGHSHEKSRVLLHDEVKLLALGI
jgi:hypothetical protein